MKEVTEKNKIIAEFMGDFKLVKEFKPEPEIDVTYMWLKTSNKEFGYDTTDWRDYSTGKVYSDQVCYERSWDWLMPVVEKIEELGYAVIITQNVCSIKCSDIRATMHKPVVEIASDYSGDNTKMSNTYKAILQFIKWYKENT